MLDYILCGLVDHERSLDAIVRQLRKQKRFCRNVWWMSVGMMLAAAARSSGHDRQIRELKKEVEALKAQKGE